MQIVKNDQEEKKPGNILKIFMFWSIFFLVIFLGKKLFASPEDNVDFIVMNLLSFGCTVVLSGILLHFLSIKSLKISLLFIWAATILLIIT